MTILAAYKPSAAGEAVLAAAKAEARLRGSDLLIVRHVKHEREGGAPLAFPQAPSGRPQARDEAGQDISKLREEMEALSSSIKGQDIDCEAVLLDEGDDHAEPILELARRAPVDLIVVGVRRRSRVGKAILGSESQRILLEADCPVLAVKASTPS